MRALKERARVDVTQVVADLRAIDHATAWERTMAVGKVVFHGIFAGNAVEWRTKRGNKATSLRKLVCHPHCPFKKSALSAAVNVYLFVQERAEVCQLPNITPTHVSAVCSLPVGVAFELLKTASSSRLTIRQLTERAQRCRRESGERRGRPRSAWPARVRTMGWRSFRGLARMSQLLEQGRELDESYRAQVLELLESVRGECERVEALLQPRLSQVKGITRTSIVAERSEPSAHDNGMIGAA